MASLSVWEGVREIVGVNLYIKLYNYKKSGDLRTSATFLWVHKRPFYTFCAKMPLDLLSFPILPRIITRKSLQKINTMGPHDAKRGFTLAPNPRLQTFEKLINREILTMR